MMDDMSDLEKITWMESRFGLCKTVNGVIDRTLMENLEGKLLALLVKYRTILGIHNPVPKIGTTSYRNKVYFTFLDRKTGTKIRLSHWLANKEIDI